MTEDEAFETLADFQAFIDCDDPQFIMPDFVEDALELETIFEYERMKP